MQPTEGTGEPSESELRELVATAGAILYHQGLVDYLGHCSVRVPGTDRVIIKPKFSTRTRAIASVRPEDLLVVDLDCNNLEGAERPPAEVWLHTSIYRERPDVTAVVHTHQPAATLIGLMELPVEPVLHVPSVLADGGKVGLWRCAQLVNSPALGHELVEAMGEMSLCHMQGHGVVSVGDDLRSAALAVIALEQLSEANLRIRQAGVVPRAISDEDLAALRTSLGSSDGRWAYYEQMLGES